MTPGEIQKLFDAYLVMEAQQALELSDQQYPQFLTRLRTLQDTRRAQSAGTQSTDGAVAAADQSARRKRAATRR